VKLQSLIAELDEFKGTWRALGTLAPERLSALRRVATIETKKFEAPGEQEIPVYISNTPASSSRMAIDLIFDVWNLMVVGTEVQEIHDIIRTFLTLPLCPGDQFQQGQPNRGYHWNVGRRGIIDPDLQRIFVVLIEAENVHPKKISWTG
jgi:hypothetical protein